MQQNRFSPAIIAGKNTQANLLLSTTYALAQGELAMSTDTQRLFVGDSVYKFVPVQSLELAVVDMADGQVLTDISDGSIMFTY